MVQFEARPVFNPLFYPYLEWLIAENSYLKISGVMQVQRQVDIFLDQIYVSLQAVRRQQVTETSERGYREWEVMTSRHVGKGRRGGSALDEFELLDEFEPLVPDFVPDAVSTKTVTQKVDLSQAVRENQYCVILGAPGAGKQWQRVGDEQTRELLAAIQANEGVKRLTANPLLLTILALIHRNGSRLPHRRVELYALAVKRIALAYWRLGRIYQAWGKYEQAIAHQFLSESLQLYRELDLTEKAAEVEQLMLFSGE